MSKLAEKQKEFDDAVRTAKKAYDDCDAAEKTQDKAEAEKHRTTFNNAMTAIDTLKSDIANLKKLGEFDSEKKNDRTPPPRTGDRHDEKSDDDGDDEPEFDDEPPFKMLPWGKATACGRAFKNRRSYDDPIKMQVGAFAPVASQRAAQQVMDHERRALYGSAEAQGGYLVQPDLRPGTIDRITLMPLTILDLINVSATTSDTIEFVIEDSMTNNAAVVPEWDTVAGDFGLKPESNLGFNLESTTVKTIATYIRASRRIMRDAPRLRATVDNRLPYMLRTTLEGQILSGSGVGNNFRGILNTVGTLARLHQDVLNRGLAADTIADTLRRAISDVYVEGFPPDVIVVHPFLGEKLELLKDDNKQYLVIFDPVRQTIWRVPVVFSLRIAQTTAIVGNFGIAATLYDRQQTEIRVGEPGDLFLKNAIAILAELSAAFAVEFPKALNIVTALT